MAEKSAEILREKFKENYDSLPELHSKYVDIIKENVTIKKMLAKHHKEHYSDLNSFSGISEAKIDSVVTLYNKLYPECADNVDYQLSALNNVVNGNVSHLMQAIREYINPFGRSNFRNL